MGKEFNVNDLKLPANGAAHVAAAQQGSWTVEALSGADAQALRQSSRLNADYIAAELAILTSLVKRLESFERKITKKLEGVDVPPQKKDRQLKANSKALKEVRETIAFVRQQENELRNRFAKEGDDLRQDTSLWRDTSIAFRAKPVLDTNLPEHDGQAVKVRAEADYDAMSITVKADNLHDGVKNVLAEANKKLGILPLNADVRKAKNLVKQAKKIQNGEHLKRLKRKFLYEAKTETLQYLLKQLPGSDEVPLDSQASADHRAKRNSQEVQVLADIKTQLETFIKLQSQSESNDDSDLDTRMGGLEIYKQFHEAMASLRNLASGKNPIENIANLLPNIIAAEEITKRYLDEHIANPKTQTRRDRIKAGVLGGAMLLTGVLLGIWAILHFAFPVLFAFDATIALIAGVTVSLAPLANTIFNTIYNKIKYHRNPTKAEFGQSVAMPIVITALVIGGMVAPMVLPLFTKIKAAVVKAWAFDAEKLFDGLNSFATVFNTVMGAITARFARNTNVPIPVKAGKKVSASTRAEVEAKDNMVQLGQDNDGKQEEAQQPAQQTQAAYSSITQTTRALMSLKEVEQVLVHNNKDLSLEAHAKSTQAASVFRKSGGYAYFDNVNNTFRVRGSHMPAIIELAKSVAGVSPKTRLASSGEPKADAPAGVRQANVLPEAFTKLTAASSMEDRKAGLEALQAFNNQKKTPNKALNTLIENEKKIITKMEENQKEGKDLETQENIKGTRVYAVANPAPQMGA